MRSRLSSLRAARSLGACAASSALLASTAAAQGGGIEVQFSVDYHGPLIGTQVGGGPITAGDVLVPQLQGLFGPAPPPAILQNAGQLGLAAAFSQCAGLPGGVPACPIDVDALSYGHDLLLTGDPMQEYHVYFTVDEYAVGSPALLASPGQTVLNQAPVGESSADIFASGPLPPGPSPLPVLNNQKRHGRVFDGNGLTPGNVPGPGPALGLTEPNDPGLGIGTPGATMDTGDHIDALSLQSGVQALDDPVYFSLDAGFIDPVHGYPNSGAANFAGFAPGDVLVFDPAGGGLQVYIPRLALGLSPFDDLDALILRENGVPGYQPTMTAYDWVPPGGPGNGVAGPAASDMVLFSVRRGSPLIGTPDPAGISISEGDLLIPPPPGGGAPRVFVPAERMGLRTERSDGSTQNDDLSGAALPGGGETFADCNSNGVDDGVDIALGTSTDTNLNGVPDECEPPGSGWCYCPLGLEPCGNDYAPGGCENVTGVGGILTGSGSSSIFADDLVLTASQLPTNNFALTFVGQGSTFVQLGNGNRCVDVLPSAGTSLYRRPICATGATGTCIESGIIDWSCNDPMLPAAACIMVGSTWHFQTWYRDNVGMANQGACGLGSNVTNAWEVTFTD